MLNRAVRWPAENGSKEAVVVPGTPRVFRATPRYEITITLAIITPERLCSRPDLAPGASPTRISSLETDPAWQLPVSTAPPSLRQAQGRQNQKLEGTIKYKEGREQGYANSIGVGQPRECYHVPT